MSSIQNVSNASPRSLGQSMWRGLKCRCPSCGETKLFASYLKTRERCEKCGMVHSHHRADDFPPYLTILIVGHIVVALVLIVERNTQWSTLTHLLVWIPTTILLSLAMLQPIKGAVVGLQWALRMHGFGNEQPEKTI